ncbi:MAG: hypothetical protein KGI33_11970 [Thaumarchaeota archaeon]|nr:hypothetical protein [Nitrososphaerota archaeon]
MHRDDSRYQEGADDIRNASRQNPKYPSDFYSMLLREADIKVLAIRELYMRLIGEELE